MQELFEMLGGPRKGEKFGEGKTKELYAVKGKPELAIFKYKDAITAFDNKKFNRKHGNKAETSNTTNARVFELLNRAGVPTAFRKQLSKTEFLAERCMMIPLEVVIRRYAVGSFLKRNPDETYAEQNGVPYRFDTPLVEFFLKTTDGQLTSPEGDPLVSDLDTDAGQEDPFIQNPGSDVWHLAHSKKAVTESGGTIGKSVERALVLRGASLEEIELLARQTFEEIEEFFSQHGFKFIDLKIEFGITPDGRLVVADVIDNDSWRLRDPEWKELSKQAFRDKVAVGDENLADVESNYAFVAALLEKSRL